MSVDFTTNPPQIDAISASPITHGTILKYGNDSITVAGLLVDSYSRSAKYAAVDEIIGQTGVVEGLRMADARVEISVSGRIKSTATTIATVGSILTIGLDSGVINDINLSAGSKEFTKVDIKMTCYEGITGASPNLRS